MIQAQIFSILQFRRFYFSSVVEAVSSLSAVVIVILLPFFLNWIRVTRVDPPEDTFITIKEKRNLFKLLKRKHKSFAVWTPVRKLLMSLIIVLLQSSPRLQILGLMTLSMIQLSLVIHFQPFRTKEQNIFKIICEILFLLAQFLLLGMPLFEKQITVF